MVWNGLKGRAEGHEGIEADTDRRGEDVFRPYGTVRTFAFIWSEMRNHLMVLTKCYII